MKIHFSIDDCLATFRWLTINRPGSIFDMNFFGTLLKWHKEYGLKVTLYVFVDDNNGFSVADIPKKYIKEFEENSDWIAFGYHGLYGDKYQSNIEKLKKELMIFNEVFRNQSLIWRMHCWRISKIELECISQMGVNTLLCPNTFKDVVYDLDDEERDKYYLRDEYKKGNMHYLRTELSFDTCEESDVNNYIENSELICFVHEWIFAKKSKIIDIFWGKCKNKDLKFYI